MFLTVVLLPMKTVTTMLDLTIHRSPLTKSLGDLLPLHFPVCSWMPASLPVLLHLHRSHGRRTVPSAWPFRTWNSCLLPRILRDSNCILLIERCRRLPLCSNPLLLMDAH